MIIRTDVPVGGDITHPISELIAERTDSDICELPPLYETIDPGAINTLLRSPDSTDARSEWSVNFSYCGYRITVDSTGQVQLQSGPEATSSTPSSRD